MPEITKASLTEKIAALTTQKEQTIAQANGLTGAIQLLEQLVAEIDAPTPDTDAK